MDINRVVLTGRMAKDIEMRETQTGKKVGTFSLAVNVAKDKAYFINCVAWGNTASLIEQYCNKGSKIGIEGRLQTRDYETVQGKRYITEVIVDNVSFLESRKESNQQANSNYQFNQDEMPF